MPQYASPEDVASFLDEDVALLPDGIERLIERASELIEAKTYGRASADEDAVVQATCAQVEYWLEVDESVDVNGSPVSSYSIGGVNISYQTDREETGSSLAPRAYRFLLRGGFLNKVIQ